MVLKCELCQKRFKRLEDAFIHPFSFIRPRIVHRECINHNVMMLSGFGPFLPITRIIDMAVPSITFLVILTIFFLSLIPLSLFFFIFLIMMILMILFRINFLRYLFEAKNNFYK